MPCGYVMENKEHIRQLLRAFEAGKITRAEFDELHRYLADHRNEQAFSAWIDGRLNQLQHDEEAPVKRSDLFRAIVADPRFKKGLALRRQHRLRYWLGGVAAVLCLSVGLWWMQEKAPFQTGSQANRLAMQPAPSVSPQVNKATLRLADGTTIDLGAMQNGVVANEDGASVILDGKELVYRPQSGVPGTENASHSIQIPKGMQYQLTLPDGSRVWLNAASSITFPVQFSGTNRTVKLSGEAFFDVKQDAAKPFIVQTPLQSLEVLGTSFNVSAYADDGYVRTSLVSGSVRIDRKGHDDATNPALVLKPGEESLAKADDQGIKRSKVDTQHIATWRAGLFTFHNEPVEEVMRKVARWYDIEVEYRDGMAGKRIGGNVPRFDNIDRLMRALQSTGLLHYKMEGGKVVITK